MHSWRVLLLPLVERNDIYRQYNFNEPWDGPSNRKLADKIPEIYGCWGRIDDTDETSYVAIVGPGTVWPGATGASLKHVIDSKGATILLVEVANSGINWLEPRDLPFDEAVLGVNGSRRGISSNHPGGANVVFCDRSVRFLPDDVPPETLRAMLTISGGEAIDESQY